MRDIHQSSFARSVLYKVSDTRVVVAVEPSDSSSEDLDLPERCRVLKLANSVTYDRYPISMLVICSK